jgi:hypothetical protein
MTGSRNDTSEYEEADVDDDELYSRSIEIMEDACALFERAVDLPPSSSEFKELRRRHEALLFKHRAIAIRLKGNELLRQARELLVPVG